MGDDTDHEPQAITRRRLGSGAVRGQRTQLGTEMRCSCGEKFRSNYAPSQGGTESVRYQHGEHVTATEEGKMESTRYTFTVSGPVAIMGAWRDVECSEYLWGSHSPEPMTMAEIEELVSVFDVCSPIKWDGLIGEYYMPADPDINDVVAYTITLEKVSA